ncbi:MAG: thiamine-monophosphate kinase [Actinomycetota bacterium]|jgi:thiamine-monophosphate kinase|nr:thiamine-monophosphate kinase [Actinomycetota bacterium]
MTVSEVGEFGLIARVTARLPQGSATILGPGDDAAIVLASDGRVVVSTDLLVEGRHFRRDWSGGYDVGRKAAAANLADIAAMGAQPTSLVVGLACPPDLPLEWAEALADGLREESALVGASVVGGDVSRADSVIVAVTALGDLQGRAPVTRAGARAGDVVAVAGRLGWSAAGHAVLSRGFRSPRVLVDAHRRPEPPYAAGPAASVLGATAMCDVSDGLIADLGHLAVASGVGIDLRRDAFTVTRQLADAAQALGKDPIDWVLTGGEDHALVATFPATVALGADWRVVGAVRVGSGVTVDGEPWEGTAGHDHFARP